MAAVSTAPLLQQEGTASSSAGQKAASLPLLIGLPLVIVLVSLVVVLLVVLLWLNYRSKQKNQVTSAAKYQSVPTREIGPVINLPYPAGSYRPKIKMMDPPIPGTTTTFVEATQLGPVDAGMESRYPFTDTDNSSGSSTSEKRKSRRLGSRRSKQQPHDVKFRSSDRSSDGSEDGYSSPWLSQSSLGPSRSSAVTPPPSPIPVTKAKVEEKSPELFLSLVYQESEAVLLVKVERASGLPYRPDGTPVDAYVRVFFIPKVPEFPQRRTSKTKPQRREDTPIFDEVVEYKAMGVEELINSNLRMEILDYRAYGKHMVLGQADLPLIQVQFHKGEAAVTLKLKPPKVRENLGTVLVSICYSPDTKKMGVIVLRAKDLNKGNSHETDAQVKIWITLSGDKIIGKMRTKKKAQSCSPIFNEALTATIEPVQVKNAAVNIAVINDSRHASKKELGQVILCSRCSGEEFRHWNDVMATPGKHIAEWHELR